MLSFAKFIKLFNNAQSTAFTYKLSDVYNFMQATYFFSCKQIRKACSIYY
jgi:hypothetical protein